MTKGAREGAEETQGGSGSWRAVLGFHAEENHEGNGTPSWGFN